MKALSEFAKATLIGGLVVMLPLGLFALVAEKIVEIIRPLADSIADCVVDFKNKHGDTTIIVASNSLANNRAASYLQDS
jgi:hypothetical protein